jgi:hypothetical protein
MRKYENVDVTATLGAIMEINTEHYKDDFRYDVEMFKEAAQHPDSENNRLVWLSRRCGTECFFERDVYLVPSKAYETWQYHANSKGERPHAYAVCVKGTENGHIIGDIFELDYRAHAADVKKDALATVSVQALYADGTLICLPHRTWDAQREHLYHGHGDLKTVRRMPEDEDALHRIVKCAHALRERECRPAVFKVAIQHDRQPSIKQQIAEGRKQLDSARVTTAQKAAVRSQGMEV